MNALEKKNLGRGLASLLGEDNQDYAKLDKARAGKNVPIELIAPGKSQPRQDFDQAALQQLADSIKSKGVLQPLLVRRDPKNPNGYELIAGERRWRAAQMAKLHEVPVVIRDFTDSEAMEVALIENVQRQDLNPIEEAIGYYRLMHEFQYTQEKISSNLGKSRSHVANMVRLLDLPSEAKHYVRMGQLSTGHAKLLLGMKEADALAREIVDTGLNVREAEELVNKAKGKTTTQPRVTGIADSVQFGTTAADASEKSNAGASNTNQRDINQDGPNADTRALEKQLTQLLGLRVDIRFAGKAGQLTIHYQNLDQLDDVLRRLGK